MKGKLFVFGCSFSCKYRDVTETDVYGHLLSQDLDMEFHNYSRLGLSNEMSLMYLTDVMNELTKDDIIIFQFTSYDRRAYLRDKTNLEDFHTSAGLSDENIADKLKQFNGSHETFTKEMIADLLSFHVNWQRRTSKILDTTIKNVLSKIKGMGVKVYTLYMSNQDFDIVDPMEDSIKFPIDRDEENLSLNFFNIDKGCFFSENDSHPNREAHFLYKEIIKKVILSN